MKKGNWSSRWIALVAVGNALLLVGLATWVWRLQNGAGDLGGVAIVPSEGPLSVEAPPVEMPLPPPPTVGRKKLPRPPGEEIVIDLDGEGRIRLSGEPVELGVLRMRLCQLQADYRRRVMVTIRASDDCLFRHVRDVMNVCEECVITTYNLSSPPAPNNLGRPGLNDTSAV